MRTYFFSECKFWSLCWMRSSLALWCHGGGKMCFSSRFTWILCWESLVAGNTLQSKASQLSLSRRKGRGWHLSTPAKCIQWACPLQSVSSELFSFPFNFTCWLHSRLLTSTCPPGFWSAFLIHTKYAWILFSFVLFLTVYKVFCARSFLYGSTVSLAWGSLGRFCSSYVPHLYLLEISDLSFGSCVFVWIWSHCNS